MINKFYVFALFLMVGMLGYPAFAQDIVGDEARIQSSEFEVRARALDSANLMANQKIVSLWGVGTIAGLSIDLEAQGREVLDQAISGQAVRCETRDLKDRQIVALCANAREQDLSLLMLQEGFVVVDRVMVYGSSYEDAYITAERHAREQERGLWGEKQGESADFSFEMTFLWVLLPILFISLVIIAAFSVLTVIIMRGFRQVVDAQQLNIEIAGKERKLRDKERSIVAKMLDSEIKANKSKIEAYLVVYEEMLSALKDPERQPKYKKAGDIVQKQPALSRAVFDRNTDKLDILGDHLSSQVVHFFARIKSNAEYVNLEPDMALDEAISIVQKSVQRARQLNKIAENLIDLFNDIGMGSMNFEDFD